MCTDFWVAPVLRDISFAFVDGKVEASLNKQGFLKVVRHVNNYLLLFHRKIQQAEMLALALSVFWEKVRKVVFTVQVPSREQLQFLDLSLFILEHHVIWKCSLRSTKDLLS